MFHNMRKINELTGLPASGKSTYVKSKRLAVQNNVNLFPFLYKMPKRIALLVSELYLFFLGFKVLSASELVLFFRMAMRENVSFIFKINIFRNTLRKFSVYYLICKKESGDVYVDEGISHIPLNYIATTFSETFSIIEPYLKNIAVKYIECKSDTELKRRLLCRGHARLKFINADTLIIDSRKIETKMLKVYPLKCHSFEVERNA